MNNINYFHIIIAITIQFVIGFIFNNWFAGTCFSCALYIGREQAQAECRIIKNKYNGQRSEMPWYGSFEIDAWNLKSILDFMLPALSVLVVLLITKFI